MSISLPENSPAPQAERLPLTAPAYKRLQVNFCKNPQCKSCGVGADESLFRFRGGPNVRARKSDPNYKPTTVGSGVPALMCRHCDTSLTLKSNQGAYQEYLRVSPHKRKRIGCPNSNCINHAGHLADTELFSKAGSTAAGTARYKCKACKRVFSPAAQKIGHKQVRTSINGDVFRLLCNGMAMRRICQVLDINQPMLYDRIRFIHQKCLEFSTHRERNLFEGYLKHKRISLSVDMQAYVTNWNDTKDKRRVDLYAMGTADNKSGYVLSMTLNYDKSVNAIELEDELTKRNELGTPAAFRDYAQYWLPIEFEKTDDKHPSLNARARAPKSSEKEVLSRYMEAEGRQILEVAEVLNPKLFQLPKNGVRIRTDYMAMGHMLNIADMVKHIPRVSLYLDQDSVFYAAAYAAFIERFKNGSADAFYVSIHKGATEPQRLAAYQLSRAAINKEIEDQGCSEYVASLNLVRREMARAREIGPFKDRWIIHPLPNKADTDKKVCHLTPFANRDERRLAGQFLAATVHGIDRFFNNVRRSLSPMERSIHSASQDGRTWNGKSNYNPEYTQMLLTIYRTYYNYCHVPLDAKHDSNPAVRFGLAKAKVSPVDIVNFNNTKA